MQSGQQVIVIVSVPVRAQGAFLSDGLGIGQGQGQLSVFRLTGGEEHLHRVHGLAQIAAAGSGNVLQCPRFRLGLQSRPFFHERHRPTHGLQGSLRGNLLELEHRRPT